MLLPIKHENMEARRWPVVTLALIAINVVVFLGTYPTMEQQAPQLRQSYVIKKPRAIVVGPGLIGGAARI